MGLSNLTREAVESALSEFDEIGRETFLDKYGFKEARSFYIEKDGKRYDSKAIAGAAHGYVRADLDPLRPVQFNGGDATVKPVMERLGFSVVNTNPRNPDWCRDELILALDFYLKHRARLPGKASQQVISLSKEISAVGRFLGLSGSETFRNVNGIYMKLMNFRRFDPEYTKSGKVGLSRGAKGDEDVWNEFYDDPIRLSATAETIRSALIGDSISTDTNLGEDDETAEAAEGRIVTRVHRVRERSPKLVKKKKFNFLKCHGKLFCEACGFDYEKTYGGRGVGFIECHHTKPVHTLNSKEKTKLEDLRLLCANCHRMVHARAPWLSMEELGALLGNN